MFLPFPLFSPSDSHLEFQIQFWLPSVRQRVMKTIKVLEYLTLGEDGRAGTIHPRQQRTWGKSFQRSQILDEAVVKTNHTLLNNAQCKNKGQ